MNTALKRASFSALLVALVALIQLGGDRLAKGLNKR